MARTGAQTSADGVGIDFGTTNSVVAVSTRSKPKGLIPKSGDSACRAG